VVFCLINRAIQHLMAHYTPPIFRVNPHKGVDNSAQTEFGRRGYSADSLAKKDERVFRDIKIPKDAKRVKRDDPP